MPFARLQTLRPRLACGCATPRPGGTACLSVSHTPPFPICRLTRAPVQTRHLWSAAPGAASYRQHRLVAHVAKPCHEEADTPSEHESGEWDKASVDTEEGVSGAAAAVDWPRLQSIAATTGGIALALVLAITLVGTTEAPLLAYNSLPDVVQDALPSKSQLGISKDTGQINIGAAVQNATEQGTKQKDTWTQQFADTQNERQKQVDKSRADLQAHNDKAKREAQQKQEKKQKDQRNKAKEREKDDAVKEKREKERREKEQKEREKRKKFKEQAMLGGYLIGRGVRVVEWNVSESPDQPDGDLVSLKLRALTPDGLRIAIAKHYDLSNFREVRQVSHWITTTTPTFYEPLRAPAAFKMLPDPAFVVWSRHPPSAPHRLPTSSISISKPQQQKHFLEDLPADQATALMLRVISGVAASSREHTEAPHARPHAESALNPGAGASALQAQQERPPRRAAAYAMANASNGASDAEDQAPRMSHRHSNASRQADSGTKAFVSAASNGTSTDDGSSGMHWQHQQQHGDLSSSNNDTASAAVTNANAVGTHSSDNNYDDNGTEPAAHGDEAAEQSSVGASSGAEQQDSDVASHESALEDQQDKRGSLQSWSDSSVLQFLHEHSAMSFAELGERLQVPQDFSPIGKVEEDSLVLAACRQHTMLSLFRAYAPHDVLMFISFARKCCWQS